MRAPILILLLLIPAALRAQLTLEPPETVDAPVLDVSPPSGQSIVRGTDRWFVLYEKAGDIFMAARDASSWLPIEQVSNDPASSTAPNGAYVSGVLHVVWEDDRSGHAETWTRRWDGASWTAEECLTCDGVRSGAPVIGDNGTQAFVAWEEGAIGATAIRGREWDAGAWQAEEPVSSSPAIAREPSVSWATPPNHFVVAWVDTRPPSATDVYLRYRTATTWGTEIPIIDNPGEPFPNARPVVRGEACCSDVQTAPRTAVVFDHDVVLGLASNSPSGPSWTYAPLSETMPGAFDSYSYLVQTAFGGPLPRRLVAHTTGSGPYEHGLSYYDEDWQPLDTETLTTAGWAGVAVSVVGNETPSTPTNARFLAAWIEDVEGTATLVARSGEAPGGFRPQFESIPTFVLVAPESEPANEWRIIDGYSGLAAPNWEVEVGGPFTGVNLDESQPYTATSDGNGDVSLSIRGGGCSETANVIIYLESPLYPDRGVKSPDVDGNCAVTQADVDYVTSQLGTSDYCADLDGSGLVDVDDVSIVEVTVGDQCSTVDVSPSATSLRPDVRTAHNPVRTTAAFRITVPTDTDARVYVLDVAGRLVRDLGSQRFGAGSTLFLWDTRTDGGIAVGSGSYFLRVESRTQTLTARVLVTR